MAYEMPAPVTCDGDIQINGREGLVISFRLTDAEGEPVNLTGYTFTFEVENTLSIALVAGSDDFEQLIIITQANTEAIYGAGIPNGNGVRFVVRADSVTPPWVPWAGRVFVLGFVGAPP